MSMIVCHVSIFKSLLLEMVFRVWLAMFAEHAGNPDRVGEGLGFACLLI